MHCGFSTVNIGDGFVAFYALHSYLNGEHYDMYLIFIVGQTDILKQLI